MGAAAAVAAEDDEMMADVAAMVGGAQGSDALASLETTLRPIEKYAVRLVEEVRVFKGPLCHTILLWLLHAAAD